MGASHTSVLQGECFTPLKKPRLKQGVAQRLTEMRWTASEAGASPSSALKAVWKTHVSSSVSWSSDSACSTCLKGSSEFASALSTTPFTRLSSCLNVGSPARVCCQDQG